MPLPDSSGDIITDRRYALALQLSERGDIAAAADLLAQTLELSPEWPPLPFRLGEALMALGRCDEAVSAFTRYLALDPRDTMGAAIKLALLGAAPAPDTLPAGYVESLFDDYAPRFDAALVERLAYRTPAVLATAVEKIRPAAGKTECVLDLGCGTGLSGAAFVHRAAWMEGIDLSANMIAEAAKKNIYDHLIVGDILATPDNASYDLAVAADVLVYIGDLEPVFGKVRRLLRSGGLFACSVQKAESGGYALGSDHRYAHSRTYMERFSPLLIEDTVIRQDGGKDVQGLICVYSPQPLSR